MSTCTRQPAEVSGERSALIALEPFAEAALGSVGRIVRPLFEAFAEPAVMLRLVGESCDAVAEAADPALLPRSRPSANAFVEAVLDLFRGCGMFVFGGCGMFALHA